MLFVIAVGLGIALRVLVRGPRPPIVFRGFGLLAFALLTQLFVLPRIENPWRSVLLGASIVVGLMWIVWNMIAAKSNTLRVALGAFALGAAMNAVPIMQHGFMPVEHSAALAIGRPESNTERLLDPKHVIVDDAGVLGDRYGIKRLRIVMSLGDFVMLGAIALFVSAAPLPQRRSRRSLGPTSAAGYVEGSSS